MVSEFYALHWNIFSSFGKAFKTSSAETGVSFQLISSKLCCDKSTSVRSWVAGLQLSEKELLFKGSKSDWEESERTEDQLIPRSSSIPLSPSVFIGTGVCRNAELKSFKGGSKDSLLEYPLSL